MTLKWALKMLTRVGAKVVILFLNLEEYTEKDPIRAQLCTYRKLRT